MAGLSTTGLATTDNYFIGRGIVYLAELVNGQPTAWRDIGNVCDLSIEADTTTIEHFTCRTRTRTRDQEIITGLTLGFNLTADEWMYENLASFFVGTSGVHATPDRAVAATAPGFGSFIVPNGSSTGPDAPTDTAVEGRYFDVYYDSDVGVDRIYLGAGAGDTAVAINSHAERVYNIDPAQLTVNSIAYVADNAGTDWHWDDVAKQVFIPKGSDLQTDAEAAWQVVTAPTVTLGLSYGIPIATENMDQVQGLTSGEKNLALKFIATNGTSDTETHEVIFHQARIRPSGSLTLIAEDGYGQIQLSGSVERNTLADPLGGGYISIRKFN